MGLTIIDLNSARRQDELEASRRTVDAEDIRQRLHANPRAFVEWLFSGRAVIGKHEARVADTSGAAGESLSIALTGADAGLWKDFATDEGGDLIGLYMANMGYGRGSFQLALKEIAKEFLGDAVEVQRAPFQPSATDRIAEKKQKLGDKPKEENQLLGAPVESYGYYGRDGKVLAVVRRYEPGGIDPDTGKPKKTFRASPGFPSPRPLYRTPQIIQATHVVLTEGERKANSLVSVGIEATTAMGGANTNVAMVDWSVLAGKHVTIWPDKDKSGFDYAQRVAPILAGLGCRVDIVEPPADKPAKWDAHDCVMEGGDPHALISAAKEMAREESTPIPILTLADIRSLPPVEWILDGWIPSDSLGFVYGDPGCGKSFLVLDWCLHIAYGWEKWHGVSLRRVGPILYLLQEGGRGISDRVDAFKQHHKLVDDPPGFEVVIHPLTFLQDECIDALVSSIRREYRLIVVDTVSRVLPGADENLQKEMTLFIRACDRLRQTSAPAVIGVHHAGKSGDMRGSTVLRGAGDFVYRLEKERGVNPITITCEKLKDEADGWQRTLPMERINIGKQSHLDFNRTKSSLVISGMDGSGDGDGRGTAQTSVLNALELAGCGLGWGSLKDVTGLRDSSLGKALKKLVEEKVVSVHGSGRGKAWQISVTPPVE